MHLLFSIAPVIVAGVAGVSSPNAPTEAPSLGRQDGQTIARTIAFSMEFELIEMSASQDGEEIPAEMVPAMTRSTSAAVDTEFTETVLASENGLAVKLARTYESAATHSTFDMEVEGDDMGMEPVSESDDVSSDVEGQTVIVTRENDSPNAGAWSVAPGDDCGLSDEDVAGLHTDYGLGILLPTTEVEKGDEWSIELDFLSFVLEPVGELPSDAMELEGPVGPDGGLAGNDIEPEFEGEITAAHAGTREVDGVTLSVYKLTFDCGSEASYAPDLDALEFGGDEGGFAPTSIEVEIEEAIDGEGEALFDPAQGLFVSLEASLSIERTKLERLSFDVPEMGEVSIEQSEVEEGEIEVSLLSSIVESADK